MTHLQQLIDPLHLEDLRNVEHPSIFDENETYEMLIIRLPLIQRPLQSHSISFILTTKKSHFYDKTLGEFQELGDKFEGPYQMLDKHTDKLLKSFRLYKESILDMEESLYTHQERPDFMTQWLQLKQDILRIERILTRTCETMQEFIDYFQEEETFPINHYIDLHEHLDRTLRSSTLQLSKLDDIYNYYNARTNEKMNRSVYLLTVISAIFLPLNLLVGFFGMNTSGLPFAGGEFGTVNAIALMLSLVIITSLLAYAWQKKQSS